MEKISFDRCSYINEAHNVNEINNININESHKTIKSVQTVANRLFEKLGNENNMNFYHKVAWKLPEHRVWSNLEIALTGQYPQRYFTYLCKMEMS
jgi:hypothetical protein